MRPTIFLLSALLLPVLGLTGTLVAADGPTMSSLNDPQPATPPAPATGDTPVAPAAAPASAPDAGANAPAAPTDASAGGPIQHAVVPPAAAPVAGDPPKKNRRERSNLARAAKALDAAIAELNRAPDDFGGNKADAIKDCEAARDALKLAIAYRAAHPIDPTAPK